MNATQFYSAFENAFLSQSLPQDLRRLAGPTSKWKCKTAVGDLTFAFATNFKTAGLLPHLPGEFRLTVTWSHKKGNERLKDEVSFFQYTTEDENEAYAKLQRQALERFLSHAGKEGLRSIFNYAADPKWLPRPNFDDFGYYFEEDDAQAFGAWYGTMITPWVFRFIEAPESRNDWCWRVLWPDATRPKST